MNWTMWGILAIEGIGERGSGISDLCWGGQKPRSQPEFQLASEARAVLRDWAPKLWHLSDASSR